MGRGQTGRRGDERREPSVESEDRKDMDTEVTSGAARCGSQGSPLILQGMDWTTHLGAQTRAVPKLLA